VGRDSLLLPGVKGTGPTHATHDFVEDQQCTMVLADLPHSAKIPLRRCHTAGGGSDHRFGNEGGNRVRSKTGELRIQLGRQASYVVGLGPAIHGAMIGEGWTHMAERLRKDRRIRSPPAHIAASRQGSEGVAVIALATRDEADPLWLAFLDE